MYNIYENCGRCAGYEPITPETEATPVKPAPSVDPDAAARRRAAREWLSFCWAYYIYTDDGEDDLAKALADWRRIGGGTVLEQRSDGSWVELN